MAEIIPTGRASPVAAAASGGILVLLVLLLLTHRYAPGATAALVAMTCGVFHFRRLTREKKKELVQTPLGCIALIPCVIVAIVMAWYLQWFLYLAIAAGPVAAITESVRIVPVKGGPDMLSNGAVVNGRLLTGISLVAQPLGVILGLLGLLRLVDNVGRYLAALLRRI